MDGNQFQALTLKTQRDLNRAINKDLPIVVGKTAVDMFTENFDNQGFFGDPWQEVQRRKDTYTVRGKVRKNYAKGVARTSPILVGVRYSGGAPVVNAELKRSLDYDPKPDGTVNVFSDKEYADYQNEGTDTIPQRQFIGEHPDLQAAIEKEVERKLNKILGI
jgi:phage gpG-like protein